MAEKAKKSTKAKKPAAKTTKATKATKAVKKPAATTTIKSSVIGKKERAEKPAMGKVVCLIAIVVSLLVIIVAVMLNSFGGGVESFVSDGTKYVLNVTAEEDNDENIVATHVVYYYKDDAVTGVKTYYEFATVDDAKAAYETIKELVAEDEEDKNVYELKGKYIIVTSPEEDYAEMKASDVKAYIDLYEAAAKGELLDDGEEEAEETE